MAKFDEPGRDTEEWERIEQLRNRKLPGIILPLSNNRHGDGVIVAESAGTRAAQGFLRLKEFLRRNLKNPGNLHLCCGSLDLAFQALEGFYKSEPGRHEESLKNRPLRWKDLFPDFDKLLPKALSGAEQSWNEIDLSGAATFNVADVTFDRCLPNLPNPFLAFTEQWSKLTHRLWLSRTHGDMNLSNLLVCPYPSGRPHQVFVVDVDESKPDQAPAADFAFLEAQFWNKVFFNATEDPTKMLSEFIVMRDWTDGRCTLADAPPTAKIVNYLRHLAYKRLATKPRSEYRLNDFFHCLYFNFFRFLTFPSIQKCAAQMRLNIVGAALSLQVLMDLEDNYFYAAPNGHQRPWESDTIS